MFSASHSVAGGKLVERQFEIKVKNRGSRALETEDQDRKVEAETKNHFLPP